PVSIHFHERGVAAVESPAEPCQIGGPEACFALPVQYKDPVVRQGHVVGEFSRPIGTSVVDDERMDLGARTVQPAQHPREVVTFVVGGDDHQHPLGRVSAGNLLVGSGVGQPVPSVSSSRPASGVLCRRYSPTASAASATPISAYSTDPPS